MILLIPYKKCIRSYDTLHVWWTQIYLKNVVHFKIEFVIWICITYHCAINYSSGEERAVDCDGNRNKQSHNNYDTEPEQPWLI